MKNIQTLWNKYSYFNLIEKESLMNEMSFAKALLEFNSNDDERKADIAKREDKIMRSIKFRAFNNGKMYYNIIVGKVVGGKEMPPTPIEEANLMQFTGLLDKNGEEIYEGDILKDTRADDFIDVIEWRGYGFAQKEYDEPDTLLEFPEYAEVIGNIYEDEGLINNQ